MEGVVDEDERVEPPAAAGPARRRRRWVVPAGLTAALATPLVVALVVLRDPHWYPMLDVAMTELRIRDVTSTHPPLVGLPGRIQGLGHAGSHPGPVSFWALAPLYRLFGGTAWAMQAATATLNLLVMAATVWVLRRRLPSLRATLAVAAALAVLLRAYEAERLTEAWNPYLPMMWWFLFLLAVWSVLCDDLAMLPVAAAAGSFCAQTHVPYLGLAGGLGAVAVAATLAWFVPRRHDAGARRRLLRWGAATAGVVAVLWLPVAVDQLTSEPGNVSVLVDSFRHPVDPHVSLGEGLEAWLARLDVTTLVTKDQRVTGSPVPGLLLLAAWAAAAVLTFRRPGNPGLRRLHVVAAAALALGLISITRVPGTLWDYLVLWAWGTTVLVLAATAWTVLTAAGGQPDGRATRLPITAGLAVLLGVTLVSATVDAGHAQVPQPGVSRIDRHLIPPTIEALEAGDVPGGGRDGRYLIAWDDAITPGLNGYAFLLELERQGFDAGMPEAYEVGARPHRVMSPDEATAVVTYVAGPQVERWRDEPGAVLVAEYEPPADEQEEYAELRREAVAAMRDAGLDDIVPAVDENLLGTAAYVGMPGEAVDRLRRMIDIGAPAAVFVTANPPPAGG